MTRKEREYEAALRRAFVDYRADYIYVTSRREQFRIQSAGYGAEQGWLTMSVDDSDEQSTVWIFRLTAKGRKHFGLGTPHA